MENFYYQITESWNEKAFTGYDFEQYLDYWTALEEFEAAEAPDKGVTELILEKVYLGDEDEIIASEVLRTKPNISFTTLLEKIQAFDVEVRFENLYGETVMFIESSDENEREKAIEKAIELVKEYGFDIKVNQ